MLIRGSTILKGPHRRRGVAATELALLLPLLLFMLVGAVDFARLYYAYTTVTNAARNGAIYLSDPLASTQSPYANYQSAALADANGLNPALTTYFYIQNNPTRCDDVRRMFKRHSSV